MSDQSSSDSAFNPDTFLQQEVVGANETQFTPIPQGEYIAYIDDLGMDKWVRDGKAVPILLVSYVIPDEGLKTLLGLEKPTVQDRIFLDVDESNNLLFGTNKNVRLGKLREACGQNDASVRWNFNMLRGVGPLRILVEHNYDKKGAGPFANIARVTRGD